MHYQEEKERRISIFEDTVQFCERQKTLLEAIQNTWKNTVLYRNPLEELAGQEHICQLCMTGQRGLEMARQQYRRNPGCKVGLVNFASATAPGGGVIRGMNASEEHLCRCTTLYPCLNVELLKKEYYEYRQRQKISVYVNHCVYTPGIVAIKTDEEWPRLMEKRDWFSLDIINCAIPDFRQRIACSMRVAIFHKVDILVVAAV